jgi:hypothetical protein
MFRFHSSNYVILSPLFLYADVFLSIMKKLYCLRLCFHILHKLILLEDITSSQHDFASLLCVQAFREYYPSSYDDRTVLECIWVKDKFVLHEKMKGSSQVTGNEDQISCGPETTIQYETLGLASEG